MKISQPGGSTTIVIGTTTITGGTTGSVLFVGAGSVIQQDNANFFWDDTNNRLGIGTATPAFKLDILGTAITGVSIVGQFIGGTAASAGGLKIGGYNTTYGGIWSANVTPSTANYMVRSDGASTLINSTNSIKFEISDTDIATITTTGLGLGLTPSSKLDVLGASLSGSQTTGLLSLAQTWNTSGTPTAIDLSITNTASNGSSLLINLKAGASGTTSMFKVGIDGTITTPYTIVADNIYRVPTNGSMGLYGDGNGAAGLTIYGSTFATAVLKNTIAYAAGTVGLPNIATSGTVAAHAFTGSFSPTSGTAVFNFASFIPTINQTGGANGITRVLYINPTLTAAADFRAIDVGNGSIAFPYVAKTTTYSIANNDHTVDCTSGTFTATLPTAVGCSGRIYVVKNSGAGTITIATTSAQTIDGAATVTLSTQYSSRMVQSNGANWITIAVV